MIADQSTIIERSALADFYDFAREEWSLELEAYNQASVGRRLRKILNDLHLSDLDTLRAYYLGRPQGGRDFIRHFTVPVTEMFREPEAWRALVDHVFPRWRAKEQIRVLHVGCSSGEEVLSLCILAEQEGLRERLQITATDINEVAMEKLGAAAISRMKLPWAESNFAKAGGRGGLAQYYLVNSSMAFFQPHLLETVYLRRLDICRGELNQEFDLIFCRNTLIYFNTQWQNRILEKLWQHLKSEAFLCIGEQESLLFMNNESERFARLDTSANLYQKR